MTRRITAARMERLAFRTGAHIEFGHHAAYLTIGGVTYVSDLAATREAPVTLTGAVVK